MIFDNIPGFIGLNSYLKAVVVFVVLFVLLRLALYVVEKVFIKLTSKTASDLDDLILAKSSRPLNLTSMFVSLIFALRELSFSVGVEGVVYNSLYSLLAVTLGYLVFVVVNLSLGRVWKKLSEKTESDIDDTLGQLVQEALRIILVVVIAIIVLNIWGVEIGPFLAGLGIAGLAVALALQPILGNVFSGIAIIMDGTFKVGDIIKMDNGMSGEVFKIGLRTTRIKSFDNDMIIVPNSVLAGATVQNFLQPDHSVRVTVEFGVEYGVDPEYVKKFVLEEVESIEFIDKDKDVAVLFTEMADNSLNFKVRFWVDEIGKKWPAHQEAMSKIYRRLYKEEIGIPYPQRTVWMRDEKNVKSPDPSDEKFKSVKGKYYSDFGREYVDKGDEKGDDSDGGGGEKGKG